MRSGTALRVPTSASPKRGGRRQGFARQPPPQQVDPERKREGCRNQLESMPRKRRSRSEPMVSDENERQEG